MSAVFKTKLRPRFIGPFTVVAKKGLAYALNLPRELCTHPVLYVGLLKPYLDPSQVDREALAPRKLALLQAAASTQEVKLHLRPCLIRFKRRQAIVHQVKSALGLTQSLAKTIREPKPHGLQPTHRPPPALLSQQGNLQFHVEKVL